MPTPPLVDFFPTRQTNDPITMDVTIGYAQPLAVSTVYVGGNRVTEDDPDGDGYYKGSFTIDPLGSNNTLRGQLMTFSTLIGIVDSLPVGTVTHVGIVLHDNVNSKSYNFNAPTSETGGVASYSAYIHFKPI